MVKNRNIGRTWGLYNDTDRYAVVVDGYLGLYATHREAASVYASVVPPDQIIDDTCHGTCALLPPGKGVQDSDSINISACQAIDLIDYLAKRPARFHRHFDRTEIAKRNVETTANRLARQRWFKDFFGE